MINHDSSGVLDDIETLKMLGIVAGGGAFLAGAFEADFLKIGVGLVALAVVGLSERVEFPAEVPPTPDSE